jgi:uncharacterized protein YbjT (DUF2867 family)
MIGVLGATGQIGSLVARELALRGVEARALVRSRGAAALPIDATHADLTDPASLGPALRGVTRLLLVTPHHADQDLHEAAAIDAAQAAGVERIVKISGGPASLGPNGTTRTAVAHWRSEQRIERSGMGFTFLRPSFFAQNLLSTISTTVASTGVLAAPFGGAAIAMVDVRDVAACAVAALVDPDPTDQAWHLTGPRPVTFAAVAAHLGVRYLPVPSRLAGRALARGGASEDEIDHALRMAEYFRAGADGTPTDHVLRLSGAHPRPVEALLDEHRGAFRPTTALAHAVAHLPLRSH